MLFHYDGVVEQWNDLPWSNQSIHIVALQQTKWYALHKSSFFKALILPPIWHLFLAFPWLLNLQIVSPFFIAGGLRSGLCTLTLLHNTITSFCGTRIWEWKTSMPTGAVSWWCIFPPRIWRSCFFSCKYCWGLRMYCDLICNLIFRHDLLAFMDVMMGFVDGQILDDYGGCRSGDFAACSWPYFPRYSPWNHSPSVSLHCTQVLFSPSFFRF